MNASRASGRRRERGMNVAILVSGLPPDRIGGAELQAARVAQHLSARHDVTVLTRTATVPGELASAPRCTVVQRLATSMRGVRFAALDGA